MQQYTPNVTTAQGHSFVNMIPQTANNLFNLTTPDKANTVDALTGRERQVVADVYWKSIVAKEAGLILTQIFPVVNYSDATGDVLTFEEIKFGPTLTSQRPEWGTSREISWSQTTKMARITSYGTAFRFTMNWRDSPQGQTIFVEGIAHMAQQTQNSLLFDAMIAIMNSRAEDDFLRLVTDQSSKGLNPYEALRDEINAAHIIQTERPIEEIDAMAKEIMSRLNGATYDAILLPADLEQRLKTNPTYADYNKAGPQALAVRTADVVVDDRPAPLFVNLGSRAVRVVPFEPNYEQLKINNGNALLESEGTYGEFYEIFSHIPFDHFNWTSDNQAIELKNNAGACWTKITLMDVVEHSGIFDRVTGDIIPIEKYTNYDAANDTFDKNDDMWTKPNGEPVLVWGELSDEDLDNGNFQQIVNCIAKKYSSINDDASLIHSRVRELQSQAGDAAGKNYLNLLKTTANVEGALNRVVNAIANIFPNSYLLRQDYAPAWGGRNLVDNVALHVFLPLAEFVPSRDGAGQAFAFTQLQNAVLGRERYRNGANFDADNEAYVRAAIRYESARKILAPNNAPFLDAGATATNETARLARLSNGLPAIESDNQRDAINALEARYLVILDRVILARVNGVLVLGAQGRGFANLFSRNDAETYVAAAGADNLIINPENLSETLTRAQVQDLLRTGGTTGVIWREMSSTVPTGLTALLATRLQHYNSIQAAASTDSAMAAMADAHRMHVEGNASDILSTLLSISRGTTIGAPDRPAFPDAIPRDLLAFGSRNLLRRLAEIHSANSPAAVVFGAAFLTSSVNLHTLRRWYGLGLPLPLQALVFRPNITYRFSKVVCMKSGVETGFVALKSQRFTYESESDHQYMSCHLTYAAAPHVKRPQNIHVFRMAYPKRYVAGKSCGFYTDDDEIKGHQLDPHRAMHGHIIPIGRGTGGAPRSQVYSLTGLLEHHRFLLDRQCRFDDSQKLPGARRFVARIGSYRFADPVPNERRSRDSQPNAIVVRGSWKSAKTAGITEKNIGVGHAKGLDFLGDMYATNVNSITAY